MLLGKIFKNTLKHFLKNELYNYDTIPLKVFIAIANSGDYNKLVKRGSYDSDSCFDQWEKLLLIHNQRNNSLSFSNYITLYKSQVYLTQKFNYIKACLLRLSIKPCKKVIELLKDEGYKIKTTSIVEYKASLDAAAKKSDNILTKIESKNKELIRVTKSSDSKPTDFYDLLANLSFQLKFQVDKNITLAEYNSLIKTINKNGSRSKRG